MEKYVFIKCALFSIVFLKLTNAKISCAELYECQQQQTGSENEKELFRIFGRLLKAFEHEKHLRKQTERFVQVTMKEHTDEIGKMKAVLIGMNKTIDKLTEGAKDMKSTITSQHGEIDQLTNVLERMKIAIPVCDTLPSIEYGNVDYSSGTMVDFMATYTCNDGYSLRGGICPTPSPLLHGHVEYTTTRVDSKATYSCDVGFARDGLTERICLPTAKWEGETPVCVQVCSTPSPLLHGHVEYTSTRVGSKITYSCDVGFLRDGRTERICLPTAEWEGETPVCVQVCLTPSPLLHGHVDYTTKRVSSKVKYSCDVGFAIDGLKERICLPTAEWEGETPVCIQVCSTPPPLLHGHVEYTTTSLGSKVTYSCDVGFARDGLKERMCLPTTEWEGETPVCIQGVCSTPSPLLHGHVEYTTTRVGSNATYSCDVGYTRDGLKERICLPTAEWEGETPVCVQDKGYRNCKDILDAGLSTGDGLYTITVIDEGQRVKIEVYCDMTTDNGGWTVWQYRYDGSEEFYRVYNDYTEGFGLYPGEFWLGLKWLHALTTRGQYMMRVDLTGKDPSGDGNVTGLATYTSFSIGPAAGSYKLHVGGYLQNSTLVDRLTHHNGWGFSTKDHDVDFSSINCAVTFHGAWWYGWCYRSNLNGHYLEPGVDDDTSMNWWRWPTEDYISLVASQLSFKPV